MEIALPIDDPSLRPVLFGTADHNLRLIRAAFDVRISARDNVVRIHGEHDAVRQAARVLEELQRAVATRESLPTRFVEQAIDRARVEKGRSANCDAVEVFLSGVSVAPKSDGQQRYLDAVQRNDLTFCAGPAGTGKTYLAVAISLSMLKQHKIKRIVLVRPAVEAGEKLGFLPGDLQAKVNPYLRPLFDAMNDMMTFDQIRRFMETDVIEVIPLAFMRGRTLNHAAIILDEAQNATVSQMLMFLTRLGNRSKMIVTGDDSQSDLNTERSGLMDAISRLEGIPGIASIRLTRQDIVRHPLVHRVVEAYGRSIDDR